MLIPVTNDLFDQRGGGVEMPYGDQFWFLSGGIRDLALELSRTAPLAYIEVEFFGGVGTQTSIAWCEEAVIFGPAKHHFERTAEDLPRKEWPVNAALAAIGVMPRNSVDEFEALRLGKHRDTADWLDPDD